MILAARLKVVREKRLSVPLFVLIPRSSLLTFTYSEKV